MGWCRPMRADVTHGKKGDYSGKITVSGLQCQDYAITLTSTVPRNWRLNIGRRLEGKLKDKLRELLSQ